MLAFRNNNATPELDSEQVFGLVQILLSKWSANDLVNAREDEVV